MRFPWTLVVTLLAHRTFLCAALEKREYEGYNYYALEVRQIDLGASPADIANALGAELVEPVGELADHWLLRREKTNLVARGDQPETDHVLETFESLRRRAAISELESRSEDVLQARAVVSSVRYLELQVLRQRDRRAPPPIRPPSSIATVATEFGIQDPRFKDQWHIVNEDYPEHTINIVPVWELGFTGKGIISSVIDDGLDFTSEDLKDNFVSHFRLRSY